MSDIFISYSRPDQALAQSLADDLKTRGFKVWWDTELLGSDDFTEVIYTALSNARAAIVIWTKTSCKSAYVRDEARFALKNRKLVATKAQALDIDSIPFGFQGQHTEDVTQREQIARAVEKLGCVASAPVVQDKSDDTSGWEKVKATDDADALVAFVDHFPTSKHRHEALQRIQQLFREGTAKTRGEAAGLRTSGVTAFFQGLTFRVPKFQLSSQGVLSSIGFGVGFVIVMLIGSVAAYNLGYYLDNTLGSYNTIRVVGCVFFLICFFGWWQFNKWVSQRNFIAASIAMVTNSIPTFILFVLLYLMAGGELSRSRAASLWVLNAFLRDARFWGLLLSGIALSLIYGVWKMWRAR